MRDAILPMAAAITQINKVMAKDNIKDIFNSLPMGPRRKYSTLYIVKAPVRCKMPVGIVKPNKEISDTPKILIKNDTKLYKNGQINTAAQAK